MIYKLDNIGLYFKFINPWNIYPHIWFLNRDGTDEDLYVNDSRMEDMGVEVQKIMRYVPKGSVKNYIYKNEIEYYYSISIFFLFGFSNCFLGKTTFKIPLLKLALI